MNLEDQINEARQNGYSDDEIKQYLVQKGITTPDGTQPMPQSTEQPSGGESTGLETVLSILGGIGGGVLGAGVGGPVGLVGGGAAGQTGGRILANILEGKPAGEGAVQEAESGAVGGVFGLGAGRLLSPFLGKILGGIGGGLENAGMGVLKSQFKVAPSMARNLNLGNTVSQLAKYGVTNINDIPKVASQVTGETGILSNVVKNAVADSQPVNIGGILETGKGLTDAEPLISEGAATKFQAMLAKGITATSSKDSVGSGDPTKIFDFIKQLESKAATLGRGNDEAQALARVYRGTSNEIKDRLFSQLDQQPASSYLDDATMAKLKAISPTLADEASQATTIGQLRSLQAPFVRGSQLAGQTESVVSNSILSDKDLLESIAGGIGFGPAGLASPLAIKALGSNTGKSILGRILGGAGATAQGEMNPSLGPNLRDLLFSRGGGSLTSIMRPEGNANNENNEPANGIGQESPQSPQGQNNNGSEGPQSLSHNGIISQGVNASPEDVLTGKAPLPDTLPSLANTQNTIPGQIYPIENQLKDIQAAGGNPIRLQQIEAAARVNQQIVDQYIASHKLSPETESSMEQAPQTYDLLTRLQGFVSQKNGTNLLSAALNDNPAVQYARSQSDPQYAQMVAALNALNAQIAYDMVHGRLSNFDLQRLKQLPTGGTARASALGLIDQAKRELYSNYVRNLPRYGLTAQGATTSAPIPQTGPRALFNYLGLPQ